MPKLSDDQLYSILLEIKGDTGSIKKGLQQNEVHTTHVSHKVDSVRVELGREISTVRTELEREDERIDLKLDTHARETGAHGVAAEQRGRASVFAIVSILGAIFGAIGGGLVVLKFALKAVHPNG